MKKRKIAMLVMTGVLLTGCMGTNYLEEGVSQLEEKQYEEASKSFQGRHWTMGQKKRQRYIILSVSVI